MLGNQDETPHCSRETECGDEAIRQSAPTRLSMGAGTASAFLTFWHCTSHVSPPNSPCSYYFNVSGNLNLSICFSARFERKETQVI
jgi:hypothetical protein